MVVKSPTRVGMLLELADLMCKQPLPSWHDVQMLVDACIEFSAENPGTAILKPEGTAALCAFLSHQNIETYLDRLTPLVVPAMHSFLESFSLRSRPHAALDHFRDVVDCAAKLAALRLELRDQFSGAILAILSTALAASASGFGSGIFNAKQPASSQLARSPAELLDAAAASRAPLPLNDQDAAALFACAMEHLSMGDAGKKLARHPGVSSMGRVWRCMRVVLKVLVAARHCVDTTASEPAHDQQRLSLDESWPNKPAESVQSVEEEAAATVAVPKDLALENDDDDAVSFCSTNAAFPSDSDFNQASASNLAPAAAAASGHPPAANRAPSQEPAPPPYKWVTRALLETVERAASLRIERAKKLAISANWGVAPMVGQDDERVEEVFEVAEVAVQLLGEAVSAAGEYPGKYQISRAVEINLQLAEVCTGSAWVLEPSCALLTRRALHTTVSLLASSSRLALSIESLPRLRKLLLSCAELPQEAEHMSTLIDQTVESICQISSSLWARSEESAVTAFVYSLGTMVSSDAVLENGVREVQVAVSLLRGLVRAVPDRRVTGIAMPMLMDVIANLNRAELPPDMILMVTDAISTVTQDDMPIFTEYMGLLLQMYLDPLISSRMDQVSTLNPIREAEQSARNIEDSGAQSQHSTCNLSKPSSLPRAFLLLATAVPVGPLLDEMLRQLLNLFSELGLLTQKELVAAPALKVHDVQGYLGEILPAIAEVCRKLGQCQRDAGAALLTTLTLTCHSALHTKLLRNLWFYCSLYDLYSQEPTATAQSPPSPSLPESRWILALNTIAEVTPPLVLESSYQSEETVVELGAMLSGMQTTLVADMRLKLMRSVQSDLPMAAHFDAIPEGMLALLSTIHHLELARAVSGPMQAALSYLQMRSMMDLPSSLVLDRIVRMACGVRLAQESHTYSSQTHKAAKALEMDLCGLLEAVAGGGHPEVGRLGEELTVSMLDRHPSTLWMPRCLSTLLKLRQEADEMGSMLPAELPQHLALKRAQRFWLARMSATAPAAAKGMLEAQLQPVDHPGAAPPEYFGDLLQELVQIVDPVVLLCGLHTKKASSGIAAELSALSMRAHYNGQVAAVTRHGHLSAQVATSTGHEHTNCQVAGLSTNEPASSHQECPSLALAEGVLADLACWTSDFAAVDSQPPSWEADSADSAGDALFRATALLLNTSSGACVGGEVRAKLLRALCWAPVRALTQASLRAGTYTWNWLLSADPTLTTGLVTEMLAALTWTVQCHMGLFAITPLPKELEPKLVATSCTSSPASLFGRPGMDNHKHHHVGDKKQWNTMTQNLLAHSTWLAYLHDRWQVLRGSRSETMLQLMMRALLAALSDPFGLSQHPLAVGPTFRLLTLALEVIIDKVKALHNAGGGYRLECCTLRDNVLTAALWWFSKPPGWLSMEEAVLEEAAVALESFVKTLNSSWLDAVPPPSRTDENATTFTERGSFAHPDECNLQVRRERELLAVLCAHEAARLRLWANPMAAERQRRDMKSKLMRSVKQHRKHVTPSELNFRTPRAEEWWRLHIFAAWMVHPQVALGLSERFPDVVLIKEQLSVLVFEHAHLPAVQALPRALPFLVTPETVAQSLPQLSLLANWAPACIVDTISLMTPALVKHPSVAAYVRRTLDAHPAEEVAFFLPQLVQALRCDAAGRVEEYLLRAAMRSPLFAHRLIWVLGGEEAPPREMANHVKRSGYVDPWAQPNALWPIVDRVRDRVVKMLGESAEAGDYFRRETALFDAVTHISGILKPLKPEMRRGAIAEQLKRIPVEGGDLYLPTNPAAIVESINTDSGRPLQSAAKVPIMVTFNVRLKEEDDDGAPTGPTIPQACIFKVGDDCRQDVLALQMISLLRDVWAAAGLDLYVFPYGVLPTGYERGIIEVVPKSYSRNELGQQSDGGMLEMFQQLFGDVGSPAFEAARANFIVSSAGYAIASMLLNAKDRHNGNLLILKSGHLVHIDFGFIFEISPGGNIGFESAGFKLSHEMTQLIDPGGTKSSEHFLHFMHLVIQGYLVARQHMESILSMVGLMVDSGLPCFGRGNPIRNLRRRFHPELNNYEAAAFMKATIMDAYDKWTTRGYDIIQYLQQGITH